MKGAIAWMARNHVAANLLMLLFVVGGLVKGLSIKQEVFPEISLDMVTVSVAYPGAGPEEVEEGILLKIEDSLTGIDGIKEITATATEGQGTVSAEIRTDEDVDRVLQDIKSEVDRIDTFPEDAEKPVVSKVLNLREVVSVVIYGDVSEHTLREQAERIREELLAYPEITQVELGGVRPYEIAVEIAEEDLRRYNLTLDQVAAQIRRASLDLPGGNIKTAGGEILLRTKEKRYRAAEYAAIVIVADADGTRLRLGDIATVTDTFEDTDLTAGFDGQPAAMVKVYRVGDQKPTDISRIVNAFVDRQNAAFPETMRAAVWDDASELLASRMNLLTKNAFLGLILVIIVLGLFLEIRLALWVMLGIPISFLGAMFMLPVFDVSVNMISLFAFILALGIVVDDAIVVGENIFAHRQQGKPHLQAAIDGAYQVAIPVTFSILTTVAAFMPLAFVEGVMGKFMVAIPVVVIALLLVSLVESLFVLPAHLSGGKQRPPGARGNVFDWIRRRVSAWLDRLVSGPYSWFLERVLHNRYTTLAVGLALLMLTIGLIRGGVLKFTFMPEIDGDLITVDLQMPPGTPVAETETYTRFIVAQGMAAVKEIDRERPGQPPILRHIYAVSGGGVAPQGPGGGGAEDAGGHLASVAMLLTESEARNLAAETVSRRWREKVGEIPGADALSFTFNLVHMGADIDIQVAHPDVAVADRVANIIKASLAAYPGVRDIEDNYNRGKQEFKLRLRDEARTLGITEEDLGRQVRAAYYGAEALRLQLGRNEVKVMVRYPEEDRRQIWDLHDMRIRTPDGGEVPLERAARIEEGRGYAAINRTDRKRVINVSASVDSAVANAGEILADLRQDLLPRLKTDYPGLLFDLVGEEKERRETISSMADGFLIALFIIYALMAIPFKSYTQPMLIMAAIPFGFVGAVAGHLLMGYQLSMLSFFGLVALSGVVVNDSLLLIDAVNRKRAGGAPLFEAVMAAGRRRFRPILLTSLTTFFGLTPMILETSVQARFLIPMAISLGFGILFATVITLILIPALYLILEDVHGVWGTREGSSESMVKMCQRTRP